jgi:nitrogen-specific signal transduction histidine kinase
MEVTSKRGETYRVLIQTAPIRQPGHDITHVMEMSTNITRTRRLEDQLASLGLMIGSVSHGIKGLLTGLDGGMYLLDSGFKKENSSRSTKDGISCASWWGASVTWYWTSSTMPRRRT